MTYKRIEFIEAPIFEGGVYNGPELAYGIIKKALSPSNNFSFIDYEETIKASGCYISNKAKNCQEVLVKNKNIKQNVLKSFSNNNFPFIIGGDHSIAIASINAGVETFGAENYAVVYIDGHTDINTEETSLTHNIHGMSLAAALGLCSFSLENDLPDRNIIGKNIFILGARSIDEKEYDIIKKNDVSLYQNDLFFKNNFISILDEIVEKIGNKKVHISFDVDVFDGEVFKSTGYIMKGGLQLETIDKILNFLLEKLEVVSFDIVEYNPLLDNDAQDLKTVLNIVEKVKLLTKKEK